MSRGRGGTTGSRLQWMAADATWHRLRRRRRCQVASATLYGLQPSNTDVRRRRRVAVIVDWMLNNWPSDAAIPRTRLDTASRMDRINLAGGYRASRLWSEGEWCAASSSSSSSSSTGHHWQWPQAAGSTLLHSALRVWHWLAVAGAAALNAADDTRAVQYSMALLGMA